MVNDLLSDTTARGFEQWILKETTMDRNELIKEIKRELMYGYSVMGEDEIDCITAYGIADFILRHTEELRKEIERLKVIEADEEIWLDKLSAEQEKAYNLEQENARLRGLVESVEEILLMSNQHHHPANECHMCEAQAKIAEFKNSHNTP